MPIPTPEWDSVLPYLHKFHLAGYGRPVWPMNINHFPWKRNSF